MYSYTLFTCDNGYVLDLLLSAKYNIKNSTHCENILYSVDLGLVYKKWALANEKTCIPSCKGYGFDKRTMIQCSGCKTSYHYDCLYKETGITRKQIEQQNNKLICNIGQPCLYLRNQHFIKKWFKQYDKNSKCLHMRNEKFLVNLK